MSQDRVVFVNGEAVCLKKGETLLQAMITNGLEGSFCSGIGLCRRCRIKFLKNSPLPSITERDTFSPLELREGYRLACFIKTESFSGIDENEKIEVVTCFKDSIYADRRTRILSDYDVNIESILSHAKNDNRDDFAVVDLGTTTMVMQLIDATTGSVLDMERRLNPQMSYGADVIRRIQASISGKKKELSEIIQHELLQAVEVLQQRSGHEVQKIYVAANTTMVNLFLGEDMHGMAVYPFRATRMESICMKLGKYELHFLPAISAFVGGDIVAGIRALDMQKSKVWQLLIDLGTNGEIALSNHEATYVTSAAAGPAFENSKSFYLPGSDIIAVIADLLNQKIIDHTGLLQDNYFAHGYPTDGIIITQEDIREIQKAKAAIYTAIEILLQRAGVMSKDVQKVFLAGGFGKGLSVSSAFRIGLFQNDFKGKVQAVSNTSLAGAYLKGLSCACGLADEDADYMEVKKCIPVEAALSSQFNEIYLDALNFPKD